MGIRLNETGSDRSSQQEFESLALTALFTGLGNASVRYAVLRNYESLPHSVGARDLDIIVMPEDLRSAIMVICDVATDMGLYFATYYSDERITQFILVNQTATGNLYDLKIDFFTKCQVYGVEVFRASQLLSDLWHHNGIPVVSEKYIFLDKWLFHLFIGKPVHSKYDNVFAIACHRHKEILKAELNPIFGVKLSEKLIAGVASGTASKMPVLSQYTRIRLLKRMMKHSGFLGIGYFVRFMAYRFRNSANPQGIFLSISGPDGSGKTTLINEVIAGLRTIYGEDSVIYRHFRPEALPRIARLAKAAHTLKKIDEDYTNPNRAKPSGLTGSLVRTAYYYFDYLIGYFKSIRPMLFNRYVILFDRYFFDMIGDPERSRIKLPLSVLRLFAKLLPLPQYAFFIHVDPGEIYRRKQELMPERIQELNCRYLELVRIKVLREVDNNGPPRKAAFQVLNTILKDRDARARRLLKNVVP